jgi:branched-chain amino acid transport system substrate-binding protein
LVKDPGKTFRRLAPAILLLLTLAACGTSRTRDRGAPEASEELAGPIVPGSSLGRVSRQEAAEYQEISTLYEKALYDGAIQRITAFKKRFPKSSLTSQVENLQGLAHLVTRKPLQAVYHFKRSIAANTGGASFNRYVYYNLAKAHFEAGQMDEAQKAIDQVSPEAVDRENRIKVLYLRSRVFLRRGLAPQSARDFLAAVRLFSDAQLQQSRPSLAALLDQSLSQISDLATLEGLYLEFQDAPLADGVLYRLGQVELQAGNRAKAEGHFKRLQETYPQSPRVADANDLLKAQSTGAIEDSGPADPNAIGVLLPMKGKFARFGARSMHAIGLAFGLFDPSVPDAKVNLVIEDSGEEPEQAIRALERLVRKHHVVAVIGPLLSKGIDRVTQRAQELGVPLLSLARHSGSPGDYVFEAGLTLRLQAQELVRHSIGKLGLKRLAMAYPRDRVGTEVVQYFWDAALAQGAEIVGAESYNPGDTDFRQVVDRLSGLHFPESRQREVAELAKLREEQKVTKKTRKTEQLFNLRPIVDFEAVFIPDEPKVAGQLIPTFAYRDVDKVRFLGTSAWNSPELASRAGPSAENAVFVDAFYAESGASSVKKFVETYRATLGTDPTSMEAVAYDAAEVLEWALTREASPTRADVRDNLREVRELKGITGKISYRDGQLARELKLLTIKGGKVSELR